MVAYCSTALAGGTCMDNACPDRHDISRCEPCGCSFPAGILGQHRSGRRHLRNVAANATPNPVTPHEPPPTSSNLPSSQPPSLPSASSPAFSVPEPTPVTSDPRVTVSHEGGLDLTAEGTETTGQLSFPLVEQTILIEKTEVSSSLSMPVVRLIHPTDTPASWCGLFDDSI